jgi:hypothetical protein
VHLVRFTAALHKSPAKGGLDLLRSSFMPLGDGTHKLPIQEGDTVSIHLSERLG